MKKILLFSAFLLVSVWMIAQNAKLSKADFEFLASGVPSEQGEVAIRTVEVYKITYESAVPKDYEKDVKKHLALLNKMGTNATHKLINREEPYKIDYGKYRVLYEDEYRYTPNKSSALYQVFEPLLKEKYQEEIALLRTGEKRKDGSYHLALRNAPFMGYSNDTPSRMKKQNQVGGRRRYGSPPRCVDK